MPAMPAALIDALRRVLPADAVAVDAARRVTHSYDNSRRQQLPAVVVSPRDATEVARVVRSCVEFHIPLTARGLGSATTGAAVPSEGGVAMSFERMNRVLEVRPDDRLLTVQPGAVNAEVQAAAAAHGYFWAPDPTSSPYSTIGGNLACNAAGPRAVKYGTPRENTLALCAVTGTGDIIRTGSGTTKGVVGYDLTRLLIGSEGTLAIITEATLKLTPLQPGRGTLRAAYRDVEAAAQAVAAVMAGPDTPCAVEFMDGHCLDVVRGAGVDDLDTTVQALLLIECDGPAEDIRRQLESVSRLATNNGLIELRVAADDAEVAALWHCRRALSPAQRRLSPNKINEDVVVPVSRLPDLVRGIESLARRHALTILSFGHAGNGNLHVNLLGQDADLPRMRQCLPELFRLVLDLGGTLSGEHGIGIDKRDFLGLEIDGASLQLMHAIKRAFDPHGILNPGKVFPDG